MLDKKTFIISLVFLGFLSFILSAQTILGSQIDFTYFTMEKASLAAGEEIRGSFTLKNYENEVVPDITYSYKLLAQDSGGSYTIILDQKFSGDYFSLRPGQEIIKSFSYRLPQNLPSGRHKFRVEVQNSKGILVTRKDSDVEVRSDNKFLTLDSHFFLENGQKLLPKGEAFYEIGQIPQITFEVSNNSSFEISALPKITFYGYEITETPFQSIEKESITLGPGETQSKTYDLVGLKEPGIYSCRLTMHQNNDVISNSLDFRWQVSGKEVEVTQFRINRSSYEEGDEALVIVYLANITGFPTEEKGELQVKLFDKDNRVAGEKTEEVSLEGGRIEVMFPVTKNVDNPRVEIAVIGKNQEVLDRYQTQVKDDEIVDEAVKDDLLREKKNNFLIIAILILLAVFVIYILKKRSSASKAVFVALILGGIFLLINSSLAYVFTMSAYSTTGGEESPTAKLNWINPPDGEYIHGVSGYVQFEGEVWLENGFNIRNNELKFFISGTEDVKLKQEGDIWVIDESPGVNPELVLLGELKEIEATNKLSYNRIFQIPAGVPLGEGASRFYVQYKGQQASAGSPWKWHIAYRSATIQSVEEGGLLISLQPDKTEVLFGEEIEWTVEIDNRLPCIRNNTDVIPIIDISGSMGSGSPTKISQAKSAAKTFVDKLDPTYDQLGLVVYETNSELKATLTIDHGLIKNRIDALSLGNMTCISCGINTANQEMTSERARSDALYFHVLMTDGMANQCILSCTADGCTGGSCGAGKSAYGEALDQAKESKNAGIVIHTIGFDVSSGSTAEGLMKDVAKETGGQYFSASTGEELEKVYKAIAGLITGESPGTKVKIYIPDEFEFTGYDGDGWSCTHNASDNSLTCGEWDLSCGGLTNVPPLTFTTKAVSGSPGQEIEFIAVVYNDADKQKETAEIVFIQGQPSAEIISPVESWQKESFTATFRYFQESAAAPDLAVCEYQVESRSVTAAAYASPMSALIEPWGGFTKASWGYGTTNAQDPYNTYYMDSRAQFIILKSELNDSGFSGGQITGFHLQNYQLPGKPSLSNFRIRLKHTDKTTVTAWEGGWTDCFGPTTIPKGDLAVGEWKQYSCVTPFTWNGTDNLMIDISRNDTAYASGGGMFRRLIGSSDRMIAGRCDNCTAYAVTSGQQLKFSGDSIKYNFVPAIKISTLSSPAMEPASMITVPWTSAGDCSGSKNIEFFKEITVGEGQNCRHEGEDVCRISVRAIDTAGTESEQTGEWQRVYHIDWTPPEIEIK